MKQANDGSLPMPELPEVETVRRGLAPHLEGRRIRSVRLNRPDLRFPFPARFADRLTGAAILPLGHAGTPLWLDHHAGRWRSTRSSA